MESTHDLLPALPEHTICDLLSKSANRTETQHRSDVLRKCKCRDDVSKLQGNYKFRMIMPKPRHW